VDLTSPDDDAPQEQAPEDEADPGDDAADDVDEPDTTEEADDTDDTDDVAPLDVEATTGQQEEDGEPPMVSVTDVRVAHHGDFDRVVFEIGGDGRAGWGVLYQDEARSQGKGDEVDVAGDAVLEVAVRNVAMPFDAPEDVEAYDGPERIDGPGDGVLREVVEDTIFEGQHVFFLGLDAEVPYRIQRLDDPQRVVIDLVVD
jgi:hypothetical protein